MLNNRIVGINSAENGINYRSFFTAFHMGAKISVLTAQLSCSRILIAVTTALFTYFAIKSDLAFLFVKKDSQDEGIYMFSMIAGFVEMLVLNMMNNLAKDKSSSEIQNPNPVNGNAKIK